MAAAEFFVAKIRHTPPNFLAAVAEIAVVKDYYAGFAKKLYRGDVVAEIPRKRRQPIAPADAEMVASKTLILEEAGAGPRSGFRRPSENPVIW